MKAIKCLSLCYFMACVFMACGSNSSKSSEGSLSVTGENGQVYESYQECCEAQDFVAAHQFLAKLKNSSNDSEKYKEAKEYVFKNEALYLMSQDDETAQKRIIYLLKEEGGNNDHVSMLIDLAIENDDEAFVRTLANQYTEGVNDESLKKLIDYLQEKPNEENKKSVEKLISKHLSLSNTSLLNYLAKTNEKNNAEKIIGLLTELKTEGIRPKVGRVIADGNSGYDAYKGEPRKYCESVKKNNKKCLEILSIAIKAKNQYLAKRAAENVKTNYIITDTETGKCDSGGYMLYLYVTQEDNGDRKEAQKMLNDALKAGAFK